jgi:hypothetical protein
MRYLGPSRGLICLTATLVLQGALAAAQAPVTAQDDRCSRVSLSPAPAWLSSAQWVPPPVGAILAVDAAMSRLLLYTPDGKGSVLPEPPGENPALLTTYGNRILLKLVGRDVVSLDAKTLKDSQPHSFLKSMKTSLGPLNAVYQWTGIDHTLLAVGLVRGEKLPRGYETGLFRLPVEGGTAERLRPVDPWDYYVLGYPFLTSIGTTGYFLEIDKEADHGVASLYEVPPVGASRLLRQAVPADDKAEYHADFREVPKISAEMNGPADAPALYAKLSKMKMITGIYGNASDRQLYVLARDPSPNGLPKWWLFRVDPSKGGAIVGKALLPTTAQHLSIVVSPETFYLIERGEVNRYGGQVINSFVTVPADLLEHAPVQGAEICSRLRE